MKPLNKKIVCKDGTVLSVQASSWHYCSPRRNEGPYRQVEVAIISGVPSPELIKYLENDLEYYEENEESLMVCAYVLVRIVSRFIEECGGVHEKSKGILPTREVAYL